MRSVSMHVNRMTARSSSSSPHLFTVCHVMSNHLQLWEPVGCALFTQNTKDKACNGKMAELVQGVRLRYTLIPNSMSFLIIV